MDEEAAVERLVEGVAFLLGFCLVGGEVVGEVVEVLVEEAFFLQEVAEHEAVEDDGGEPFAVGGFGDILDGLDEGGVVFLEVVIEVLCDFFCVDEEGRVDAVDDVDDGEGGGGGDGEGDVVDFFEEELCMGEVLVVDVDEVAAVNAADRDGPEVVEGFGGADVDDEVIEGEAGEAGIEGAANGGIWDRWGGEGIDGEVAFLSDWDEVVVGVAERDGERAGGSWGVPTAFVEECDEVGVFDVGGEV